MTSRHSTPVSMVLIATAFFGMVGTIIGCAFCSDEGFIPIQDGNYRAMSTTATIENGEMVVEYVQDTDGRVYIVRLRERD